MLKFWILLAECLSILQFGASIKYGFDVGDIKIVKRKLSVTGQENYPFIVNVDINSKRNGKLVNTKCGGVIVGKKAVLTAGHCLYGEVNPQITVHAGIVHLDLEKNAGQKIQVQDYKIHEDFRDKCLKECVDQGDKCFFIAHDIAIMWLRNSFQFGPTVREALLNLDIHRPVGKRGWILGWGMNSHNEEPSMLQRGQVKVLPEKDCEKFNHMVHMPPNAICLGPLKKGTRCDAGDSGGPLVVEGVVYGIASFTVFKRSGGDETVDLYTYLAGYNDWITNNVRNGPPKIRTTATSTPHCLRSVVNEYKQIYLNKRRNPR